jgi:ribosomal protein S18 acetylase RimI-like enzyme
VKPPPGLGLRARIASDGEFLALLYASTRDEELKQTGWSESQKRAFCRSQFEAQAAHYDTHHASASFDVIERAGVPIGRLYVDRSGDEICIVELSLSPAVRGAGLGTQLLTAILDEGARAGKKVSIHVEIFNPAIRLYQRLGFKQIETSGPYHRMTWAPPEAQPKTAS